MDSLAATGEQVSSALLAIALTDLGAHAQSLVAHQTRIFTDGVYTKARIRAIDDEVIRLVLERGRTPVIAGFQGLDAEGNINTLGRGGTDTTAVAVAAAIKADLCAIYTDVEGVYTADPNVCTRARKLDRITFEEMLELSSLGAKVLHLRSVEVAMKYGIPIHVRSSFSDAPGTVVGGDDEGLEEVIVRGVVCDRNEVKLTVAKLPDRPGVVATLFEALAQANVSVDMIIQTAALNGSTDVTFTVTRTDLQIARDTAGRVAREIGAQDVHHDDQVVKVSIVGGGMRSNAGVAARMFRLLADQSINIQAITTSEIRVSCLINADKAELALRTLHDGFNLGDG